MAARTGGADLAGNPTLYDAVQKAKKSSVPNDNIDRAVRRGAGLEAGGAAYEAITYEGYAPGGVAVLVECLTDNRNRAAADVRAALTRSGVLVRRSWWRVLGVLLLTALVAGAVGQVLQVPFLLLTGDPLEVLTGSDTSSTGFVLASLGTLVAAVVVGPFAAAVRGLLYVDRRMRAEGLDVALAAAHRP